jgi:hypothetical protein
VRHREFIGRAALDKIACCNFSIETIADLVDRVANHARAALKEQT